MTKHDVVIIGCGPAGVTAGYFLASKGFSVLIFEKEKHPRKKICGGVLTEKTISLVKEVFQEDYSKLKEKDIIDYLSNEYELIFKDGRRKKYSSVDKYYFTKREKYDYFLFKKATDMGVSIAENTNINQINIKNGIIKIKNNNIKYDYLISADGVNSIIRNKYFLNINELRKWYYNIGISMQITINRNDVSLQIYHPQMYFSEIIEGYAWVFPNKKQMIIGIGGSLQYNKDIKKSFLKFIKKFNAIKIPKIQASLIPYGFYIKNLVRKNMLLTGDAAGLVDPFTGEGIYYAQKSGLLAAQSIIKNIEENTPLSSYSINIEREITSTFKYSIFRRRLYLKKA